MSTTSPPSVLVSLRHHTHDEHARLETADFVLPSTRTFDAYAQLIGAMLAFHSAIEAQFTRYAVELRRGGIEVAHRFRSHALGEEAMRLGAPRVAVPTLCYPSAAHLAGAIYVIEGSTLGGLIIARSVVEHLGVRSGYYGEFGTATAHRWRETMQQLECYARTADTGVMCDGARYTFQALHAHLVAAFGERCR